MEDEPIQNTDDSLEKEIQEEIDEITADYFGDNPNGMPDTFELEEIIENISNPKVQIAVAIHFAKTYEVPFSITFADTLARNATQEARDTLAEFLPVSSDYVYRESIEMKIAETAAEKWQQPMPKNLTEAREITGG